MKKISAVICVLAFSARIFVPLEASAAEAAEVSAMRRELDAMRAEITQMREFYDAKIENMRGKIEELEAGRVTAPPVPGGPTPLPGMGRPAFELPDISAVGNVIANYGTDRSDPDRNKVFLEEVELAIQGYLYPDIWANFIISLHRESDGEYEAGIEEGYIEFMSTPIPGLSVLAGRKLVGFGKVNPVHAHHWNYVDRPAVLESYLGDHGLAGQGVNVSYLLPLPFFSQADFGVWYVDDHDHHHHHHHHDDDVLGLADRTYSARLWSSFPIAEDQELEIGASGVTGYGPDHEEHEDKVWVGGLDLTYRLLGDRERRLLYQSELLFLHRQIPGETLDRWGFYKHLNYRFNRNWDAGLRFDWLETPFSERDTKYSISGIITRSLTETTKLRLQYKFDPKDIEHTVYLQAVFGLGPHAHALE